ncbi:ADP-forming succinate--CoA ligase subunit beta [Sodalis sp. CWE]|uniref:ADP-forming succinate--CoA ligase subunit beta n=1 Tax=Sodalis sp. CWE TaxID=2803816 RepID=UPI001C7E06DE|nr:ADP-forming succinate--CoA ligase subunit beta [Sodalis sp. CWE]MBX4180947.1 ADP-forming succinate--CoA ligase subunit beta [Sodalis sp. CWE]
MNLHEYQVKKLFSQYGLPVPNSYLCSTLSEVEHAIKASVGPWVVKCQVHANGRGKFGGVKIVYSREEVYVFAKKWLGKHFSIYQEKNICLKYPVNQILIETTTDITKELYLGITIDRSINQIIFVASMNGGTEIEKVAKEAPHLIHKITLDFLTGPQLYQGRKLAFKLGLSGKLLIQFSKIFMSLSILFLEKDLVSVEINPLAINSDENFICLDGKLNADNNAMFRQKRLFEMRDLKQENKCEVHASRWGLNYVALGGGNIGCIANGAGLAMGTMDIIRLHGGKPANFLDVGGAVEKEYIAEAFKILLLIKEVKVVLVNIFGGIVCCDLVSDGIITGVSESNIAIPIVVRLEGNNAELGTQKLKNSNLNIIVATDLNDMVRKVITAAV